MHVALLLGSSVNKFQVLELKKDATFSIVFSELSWFSND